MRRCSFVVYAIMATFVHNLAVLSQDRYNPRDREQTLQRRLSIAAPPVYSAMDDGSHVTLEVREQVHTFDGVPFRHRCYNNSLIGPIIRVKPGTNLHIRLNNQLPPEEVGMSHTGDDNKPHGYNITNLHTHGLHVSPLSPGDNVFQEIGPGKSFEYTFEVPKSHPPGTFWYHAHKHGSTALQLASGMAGALIVEGGLDEATGIKDAAERILVLQQFVHSEDPNKPGEHYVDPDSIYAGTGEIVTAINGQIVPTMTIRPGEVQRWRLIHGGISENIELSLPGVQMFEIAIDGLSLGTMIPREVIELSPGYRVDVLIKAPPSKQVSVLSTEVKDAAKSLRQRTMAKTDLLKLSIEGAAYNMELPKPDDLLKYAPLTQADVPTDADLKFQLPLRFDLTIDRRFLINGNAFDSSTVSQQIALETAGEWVLSSARGAHPFHVHVNPFAVYEDDGTGNPRWIWRDTLFIRRNQEVKVRSWFRTFPGKTVLHCHILDHEDQGMMQVIEFVEPNDVPVAAETDRETLTRQLRNSAPPNELPLRKNRGVHLNDAKKVPMLLVFHRGVACEHCAEQLTLLGERAGEFTELGVTIVGVSRELPSDDSLEEVKRRMKIPFSLWADGDLRSFRSFNCLDDDGDPLHGTFLIGADGNVLWEHIGEEPVTDIGRLVWIAREQLSTRAEVRSDQK